MMPDFIQCSHCLDMFPPEQIELGDDGTPFCRACIEDMRWEFT